MHYHLLLTDESGDLVDVRTVDDPREADRQARLVLGAQENWAPSRYPGRSWKRGEIGIYLDRSGAMRRELAILRCMAERTTDDDCQLHLLGLPALNLHPAADAPNSPGALPPRAPRRRPGQPVL